MTNENELILNEKGAAIINDKTVGIVCPHCGKLIELNILKSLKTYLERFNDDLNEIRKRTGKIDVDFVINRIMRGVIDD